jgi:hypothetical protein
MYYGSIDWNLIKVGDHVKFRQPCFGEMNGTIEAIKDDLFQMNGVWHSPNNYSLRELNGKDYEQLKASKAGVLQARVIPLRRPK